MIPVYKPDLSGNELSYVRDCLETTWISSKGKYIQRFEEDFASFVGNAAVTTSVCNGTVALHLALEALGIGNGDEVIVPTLTYVASVNAIAQVGATPVFVDSDKSTWQVDVDAIKKAITPATRAIMAVHLYGLPSDMHAIVRVAKEHNLLVIEDCAEAIGSRIDNQHVGTFGDIATFSFFGNKTITTGEGGMVLSCNRDLIAKCAHLKNQGVSPNRQYWHDVRAYNYRMTNVAAAIGCAQLERVAQLIEKKLELAYTYRKKFSNSDVVFHDCPSGYTHSYWMCSVLLPEKANRDEVRRRMDQSGIETRPVFYPIHTLPMYKSDHIDAPVATYIARHGMNLPSWPGISSDQANFIADTLLSVI